MANQIALLVLGVLLLSSAGCGSQSPEDAVRKRWEQFVSSGLRNDVDACLQVMDPAYVSRAGVESVKDKVNGFSQLLRAGRISEADLRIDKITVAEDGKTATVEHSMRTKDGKWLPQAPYGSWVKVDKTWYVTWR
jgi:hypothetical protein